MYLRALTTPPHSTAPSIGVCWRNVSDFIDSNIAEDQREGLNRIIDGESYQEAAYHMGCRVGTVKSRVSRARATLMDNFEMP
jgi:DNA-directed RNA polymerase specialized sigma24 family protein